MYEKCACIVGAHRGVSSRRKWRRVMLEMRAAVLLCRYIGEKCVDMVRWSYVHNWVGSDFT